MHVIEQAAGVQYLIDDLVQRKALGVARDTIDQLQKALYGRRRLGREHAIADPDGRGRPQRGAVAACLLAQQIEQGGAAGEVSQALQSGCESPAFFGSDTGAADDHFQAGGVVADR